MAKTGINFERCNVLNAEKHNGRDPGYIAAVNASPNKKYDIFPDRTIQNSTFIASELKGKTLPQLLDEMRKLYYDKFHQSPQEKDKVIHKTDKKTGMKKDVVRHGWAPIREGVCPVKDDTTLDDFKPFCDWLASKGPKVIRIDIHRDEGYVDPLTGERKYNLHAQVVADWLNHETGRTFKLDNLDSQEMQTQIAQSLGMERGTPKSETGIDHISALEYRAKKAAEKIIELEARLTSDRESLIKSGRQTLQCFDGLSRLAPGVPKKKEIADRDTLEKELQNETPDTTVLATLLGRTIQAISRIGARLQELAKDIPLLKKNRLAHESELQAAADEAEKTLQQVEEREAAVADREKYIEKVKQAAIAANDKVWQRKFNELVEQTNQSVRIQYAAGVREGRTAAETEISRLLATVEGKNKEMEQLQKTITSKEAQISDLRRNYNTASNLNRQLEARLQKMQQTKSRGIS